MAVTHILEKRKIPGLLTTPRLLLPIPMVIWKVSELSTGEEKVEDALAFLKAG